MSRHPNKQVRSAIEYALDLSEELADRLFEAGCEDGTPGTFAGAFVIDFHREAISLEEAIRSAIGDVRRAGHEVERAEIRAESFVNSA